MRDEEGCGDSGLFCIYDENMSNLTSKDAASIHGKIVFLHRIT